MGVMNAQSRHPRLPIFGAVLSLLAMLVLVATTKPIDNISYGVVFFGLLTVFLVSAGYQVTRLRRGAMTTKSRSRIFIVSSVILVALMLRSSGSLDWIETLVLAVIGIGLWFYSGRRVN